MTRDVVPNSRGNKAAANLRLCCRQTSEQTRRLTRNAAGMPPGQLEPEQRAVGAGRQVHSHSQGAKNLSYKSIRFAFPVCDAGHRIAVVQAASDYSVSICNLRAPVKRVSNQGRAAPCTALERGLTFLRCGVLQTLRVMKLGRLLKAVKLFRCTFQEHAVLLLCRLMIAPPSFADDDRFHPHLLSSLL